MLPLACNALLRTGAEKIVTSFSLAVFAYVAVLKGLPFARRFCDISVSRRLVSWLFAIFLNLFLYRSGERHMSLSPARVVVSPVGGVFLRDV